METIIVESRWAVVEDSIAPKVAIDHAIHSFSDISGAEAGVDLPVTVRVTASSDVIDDIINDPDTAHIAGTRGTVDG